MQFNFTKVDQIHQIQKIQNAFKHLLSEFSFNKSEIFKRKDAYPYERIDSYEKFNYKQLPHKNCFYSSLRHGKRDKSYGHISDEQ